jgi:hypothetical protein
MVSPDIFRKKRFFYDGFLMAVVLVAGSFGTSFSCKASNSTKCYGEAENRVLKRVGGKNNYYEKEFFYNDHHSYLVFKCCTISIKE